MSSRNQMKNSGIPLSVNVERDMPAVKNGSFDSWYVICNFEADEQKLVMTVFAMQTFSQLLQCRL